MYNEIDLHNLNFDDALKIFITKYNKLYKSGERKEIMVIHGYGSNRLDFTPVIKIKIRDFFSRNKEYLKVRLDLNPGVTYITPLKLLPIQNKKKNKKKRKEEKNVHKD